MQKQKPKGEAIRGKKGGNERGAKQEKRRPLKNVVS